MDFERVVNGSAGILPALGKFSIDRRVVPWRVLKVVLAFKL